MAHEANQATALVLPSVGSRYPLCVGLFVVSFFTHLLGYGFNFIVQVRT